MPSSPEVAVAALDGRLRKLIDNARSALARGHWEYACAATAQVLRNEPACVEARTLHYHASLRCHDLGLRSRGTRAAGWFAGVGLLFRRRTEAPTELLAAAQGVLEVNPRCGRALKVLARAAERLEWRETVVFALEALRQLEPDDRANLAALGRAMLAARRSLDAIAVAEQLLRNDPSDEEGHSLMRDASVAEAMTAGKAGKNLFGAAASGRARSVAR